MDPIVESLGNEYDLDTGFIGRLRDERIFDEEKAERYLATLASLEVSDSISIDLAKLIWNLPVMLQYQLEWYEPGSEIHSKIDDVLNKTVNILMETIGIP